MLLNHLSKYLESVERAIRNLEGAYVERYEEEILTVNRVNLRIRIRFQTGHMLELNEAHNTPHFQELDTYSHHKHLSERVIAVERPTIIDVIEEATLLAGETSV